MALAASGLSSRQCIARAGSSRRPALSLPSSRQSLLVARSTPKWNPQNTENPIVVPSTSFSPEDAVRAQLDACKQNDEPWLNHGIQTMYEFAEEAGSMERSRYFVTFEKDLYHMDHFMGGFSTKLGSLLNLRSYEILGPPKEVAPGRLELDVRVVDGKGDDAGVFTFTMVQKELGRKKGCWMTKSLGRKQQA